MHRALGPEGDCSPGIPRTQGGARMPFLQVQVGLVSPVTESGLACGSLTRGRDGRDACGGWAAFRVPT